MPTFAFSGHETFPLRLPWLPKAVEAAGSDPAVFAAPDATATFGVGRNMVRAIRHWGLALAVLEDVPEARGEVRPSALGLALFDPDGGADPFCESPETLWLLHWLLCRQPDRATLWHVVFGWGVAGPLDPAHVGPAAEAWLESRGGAVPSASTLRRDLGCLVGTYVPPRSKRADLEDVAQCPLGALGLVDAGSGVPVVRRSGSRGVPAGAFAFAVLDHWRRAAPAAETLAVADVLTAPGSPGRVFGVGEGEAFALFDALAAAPDPPFVLADTAGIQQLYRTGEATPLDVLLAARTA